MKRLLLLAIAALLLVAGCATPIDQTAIPVNPNVQTAPTTAPAAPAGQAVSAQPSPSGCQSKITGVVTGPNGQLLKNAQVELNGGALKSPSRTVTDDNGLYGFAGLCGGAYTLTVIVSGQPAKKIPLTASVDGVNSTRADLPVK